MLFGNTEIGLRSMSVFFGGIAIVFGYLLTNKLFTKTAARISLIFMVLAPMFIRYSQEARMYMLVAAIALAATYVLTYCNGIQKKITLGNLRNFDCPGNVGALLCGYRLDCALVWRADNVRRTAKKGEFRQKFFYQAVEHGIYPGSYTVYSMDTGFHWTIIIVQIAGFWIPPVTPGTPLNFLTNTVYYRDLGDTTGWLAFALNCSGNIFDSLGIHKYTNHLVGPINNPID
jgi:mannosyltransferase